MNPTIRFHESNSIHHGDFNVEIMTDESIMEQEEMNDFEIDSKKEKSTDKNTPSASQTTPEYCEFCFLAFGSYERRICKDGKHVHEPCAARLR